MPPGMSLPSGSVIVPPLGNGAAGGPPAGGFSSKAAGKAAPVAAPKAASWPELGQQGQQSALALGALNGAGAASEQAAKRLRLSDQATLPPLTEADQEWQKQWSEVFCMMQMGDMEARAGEYAEAVVALKKNAESLRRQRRIVESSCEQLLHTAYREALQAHFKAMHEAASAGASQEVVEAAHRTVSELMPPLSTSLGPQPTQPTSGVKLGVGMPQPGVVVPSLPARVVPPPQGASTIPAAQEATLWVGGLPEGIDDNMFRSLFARYGNVGSIKLVADKLYGFVQYTNKLDAQAAIGALNGFECNGVKLSVRFAEQGQLAPPPAMMKAAGPLAPSFAPVL